jgi:hypothetical protein
VGDGLALGVVEAVEDATPHAPPTIALGAAQTRAGPASTAKLLWAQPPTIAAHRCI